MQLPEASFAEMAVALRLQTVLETDGMTELTAKALQWLSGDAAERIIADAQRHADLMFAAHAFFKAACEREDQIRGLFAEPQPPSNDNVEPAWRRALFFWRGFARGR